MALLYYLNPEYLSSEVLLIFWLGLLLLLLGVGTLAGWVACLSPPKWDILGIYLASTGMALFWNVITALVFVFITLTLTTNYGQPFSDVLGNAHLGIILMPLGLMLALWGGNRLDRKKPKQAIKS